ncbi:MAG: AAA family ATPase, partial [Candidatus Omnitrophica bacterium]|nr:AAA family ATPase [Candidatus Omnitrophota bacterium]
METLRAITRSKINPFRPGSGLFPACLAGRFLDLELFSGKLYSTITGTPKNIIVYGDKQMGKTSVLMRMEKIAQEKKLLTVSTFGSPISIKDFIANLVLRLFVEIKNQALNTNGEFEALVNDFQRMGDTSIQENEIAFTDFIVKVWGLIKDHVPAIVFTIDDLDLIHDADQALMLLQNVTKTIYRKDCPIIFVLTTAAHFYEDLSKKHKHLTDYFEPIYQGKLQLSSLINAIRVPLWELDIPFDEAVVKEIARRADGFPFYLQQIAHHVFEEMDEEFDALALRRGYEKAMQTLEREYFIPMQMSLTPTEIKLYFVIYRDNPISFTHLLKRSKLPKGSVASSLKRLREKQMIWQDKKMYQVSDKLFGAFVEKHS